MGRVFLCCCTHHIIPELLTLLMRPTIVTLVNRNDELLFPIKESKELVLLCLHNFPTIVHTVTSYLIGRITMRKITEPGGCYSN